MFSLKTVFLWSNMIIIMMAVHDIIVPDILSTPPLVLTLVGSFCTFISVQLLHASSSNHANVHTIGVNKGWLSSSCESISRILCTYIWIILYLPQTLHNNKTSHMPTQHTHITKVWLHHKGYLAYVSCAHHRSFCRLLEIIASYFDPHSKIRNMENRVILRSWQVWSHTFTTFTHRRAVECTIAKNIIEDDDFWRQSHYRWLNVLQAFYLRLN